MFLDRHYIPLKQVLIITLIFAAAFFIQYSLWQKAPFIDNHVWAERIQFLIDDFTINDFSFKVIQDPDSTAPVRMRLPRYEGHPGSTILASGAIIRTVLGTSPFNSLLIAVSLLNAGFITGIAITAKKLIPDSPWWIAAASISTIHALYYYSSPTNAIYAPLLTLFLLLIWLFFFQSRKPSYSTLFLTGIVLGLSFATRFSTTLFIAMPLLFIIESFSGKKAMLIIAITSILTAFLITPVLWFSAYEFITSEFLYMPIRFFLEPSLYAHKVGIKSFILFSPLTLIAFSAALLQILKPHLLPNPLPKKYFLSIFFITTIISLVFFTARIQSLRYFTPFIMYWDIIFSLWLLKASAHFSFPDNFDKYKKRNIIIQHVVLAIIIISHMTLTYLNFFIPGERGLI